MNYASMIFVGLLALACTYWFYRRSHSTPYQGPGSKAGLIVAVSESHSDLNSRAYSNVAPGFNLEKVIARMHELAKHSWEYGAAAQALLELHNPELSVFGEDPFPQGKLPKPTVSKIASLSYAKRYIRTNAKTLIEGDGSTSDPSSLGVSALLIGQSHKEYLTAAQSQARTLLTHTPRFLNGAISHRADVASLWSDFIYMVPLFLAYHGVAINSPTLLREAVHQCTLYRAELRSPNGLWKHIVGPFMPDAGHWSTGNAWAAAGMLRVLCTLRAWKRSKSWQREQNLLMGYICEILGGAMGAERERGLVRNYVDDGTWFGEAAGTALLGAVAYRVAVLVPEGELEAYAGFGDECRRAVAGCVDAGSGIVAPTVDALRHDCRTPLRTGSAEAQSFVVLLYAAWRDYVNQGGAGEG